MGTNSRPSRPVTIYLYVEGKTEKAILPELRQYLHDCGGAGAMPTLQASRFDGKIHEREVRKRAEQHLKDSTARILILSDFYGTDVKGDLENRRKTLLSWLPDDAVRDGRCAVHFAKHEFEAWLLVGWADICAGLKVEMKPLGLSPEDINGKNPPSRRLEHLYKTARRRGYDKVVEGKRHFKSIGIARIAAACPEFRAFLDSLKKLCGLEEGQ